MRSLLIIVTHLSVLLAFPLMPNGDELLFVNTIFRHGARAPDIHSHDSTKSFFKYGSGQMTDQGIEESFELGRQFRSLYVENGFLDEIFNVKQVKIRSSALERCISTGIAVGQGMYSTPERSVPFPVPVFSVPKADDQMLFPQWYNCPKSAELFRAKCPNYQVHRKYVDFFVTAFNCEHWPERSSYFKSDDLARKIEGIVNEDLANISTVPPEAVEEAKQIYQDLQAWTGGFYPHRNTEVAALHSGELLYEWLENFEMSKDCTADNHMLCNQKFAAYSSQDYMLSTTLEVLGLKEKILGVESPFFSSAIITELWRTKDGLPYVKVLYRKSPTENELLDVTAQTRGCECMEKCPLQNLREALSPFIKKSRTELCKESTNTR